MSEILRQATGDVLTFLATIGGEGLRPREAQVRLRAVQARHPALVMELVWEEESYDGSVHYDVLVRTPDGETVSLSVSRDGALPWPLRGVRRWSDADLAQVNGRILKLQDAVGLLDFIWQEAPILTRLIDVCLVREELQRHPVELSDAELQRGIDAFRRANRLDTAADTHRWMQERGLTHERLEQLVVDQLTIERLRARVAEGQVERYFEAHRADFETAQVARLELPDEASAGRAYRAIAAGEVDFFAAAARQFVAAPAAERPLLATLRRRDVAPALAAAVFSARPGALLGPTRVDGAYVITRVLARTEARLDAATRAAIEQMLFDAWLAERRRAASVTWFWGSADRMPKAA